jgi:hypothetical protein
VITIDWLDHGLALPNEVTEATAEYRRDHDTLGRWLDECTERMLGDRVQHSVALDREGRPLRASDGNTREVPGEEGARPSPVRRLMQASALVTSDLVLRMPRSVIALVKPLPFQVLNPLATHHELKTRNSTYRMAVGTMPIRLIANPVGR